MVIPCRPITRAPGCGEPYFSGNPRVDDFPFTYDAPFTHRWKVGLHNTIVYQYRSCTQCRCIVHQRTVHIQLYSVGANQSPRLMEEPKARHQIISYGYMAIVMLNILVNFTSDPIRCPSLGGALPVAAASSSCASQSLVFSPAQPPSRV